MRMKVLMRYDSTKGESMETPSDASIGALDPKRVKPLVTHENHSRTRFVQGQLDGA